MLGTHGQDRSPSDFPAGRSVLLVRGSEGPTSRLVEALERTSPSTRVVVADALPSPETAARPLPDAVVLFFDRTHRDDTANGRTASGPALIIVYAEEAEEQAEACLGQGAQAIIPLSAVAETDWERVLRHSLLRLQHARRHAAGEEGSGRRCAVATEQLPALIWMEADGGLLWRADDGHLLEVGSEVSRRLDEAIEGWTERLETARETTGQELHFIADGADERAFFASARKVMDGSATRWVVLANEIPPGNEQLRESRELLRSVGHELKSPLSAILMSARLGSSEPCPKVQKEMWQITQESAETLQEVIRERLNRPSGASDSSTTLW